MRTIRQVMMLAFWTAAYSVAGGMAHAQAKAEVSDSLAGVRTVRFATVEGVVVADLPRDTLPRDTILGTTGLAPNDPGRAARMQDYRIELSPEGLPGAAVVVPGQAFQLSIPAGIKGLRFRLLRGNQEVASTRIDVGPAGDPPLPRKGLTQYKCSAVTNAGGVVRLLGPFDKNWLGFNVQIEDKPAPLIAGSPRESFHRTPAGLTPGPAEVMIRGPGVFEGHVVHVIGVAADIAQDRILQGTATSVTAHITGLRGLDSDICLRARLLDPDVARFIGPTMALYSPDSLIAGRATFLTAVQGIRKGDYLIAFDVAECDPEHYAIALKQYEQDLRSARGARNRQGEADLFMSMGLALEGMGRSAEAEARYLEALKGFQELVMQAREMEALNRLGRIQNRQGKFAEARQQFEMCLQRAPQSCGVPLYLWIARTGLGDAHAGAGRPEQAIEEYRLAAAIIEESESENNPAGLRGEVYEKLVGLLAERGRHEEALDYVQRSRAQALRAGGNRDRVAAPNPDLQGLILRSGELDGKRADQWETLRGEKSRPQKAQDVKRITAAARELASNERDLADVILRIKQTDPTFVSLVRVDPTLWADAQQDLPADIALVEYFPTKERLLVFAIRAGGKPRLEQVSVPRLDLDTLIGRSLRLIQAAGDASKELGQLYDLLIKPIQRDVDAAQVVVIMPSGSLFYVPFAALSRTVSGKPRYLIEDKPVVSLTDLAAWRLMRRNGENRRGDSAIWVAFANPTGDLEAAEKEVADIGKNYPSKEVYVKGDATRIRAQKIRDDCTILHFATHGVLNSRFLGRSHLKLADGQLTQGEVYGLDLKAKKTRLVVLSACETAIGGSQPGLEYMGLADAFSKAGASTVIGTLWKVADRSTAELLAVFYAGLMASGKPVSKAHALQQAQLKLLHSPAYGHPFFWAPFIILGEWR